MMDSPQLCRSCKIGECQVVKEEMMSSGHWLTLKKLTFTDPTGKESDPIILNRGALTHQCAATWTTDTLDIYSFVSTLDRVHLSHIIKKTWEAVSRKPNLNNSSEAVVVIPILKRLLKFDCVVLVKQYRPPLKTHSVEFPAGLMAKGELVEECAVRELLEETGFSAIPKHTSPAICLDAGISNSTVRMVTVEIDGDDPKNKSPQPKPDETEFIETIKVPLCELLDQLNEFSKSGLVVDARVYTYAIAMEQTRKNRQMIPN